MKRQRGILRSSIFKAVEKSVGLAGRLAALSLLMAATALTEVQGGGTITGHVRGPGGVSVPGATVQLIELESGERKMTWTDEAGNYTLAGASPGTYRLEVSLVGFRTDVRQPVPVTATKALKVNVALLIALPEENANASARAQPTSAGEAGNLLDSLPEEVRARLRNLGIDQGSIAGLMGGEGGNIRFSETSTAAGLQPGETSSAEGDLTASAANSFLLSGSVNRGGPGMGDEQGQWRERAEEFRRFRESQGPSGFGPGGGSGGGPGLEQIAIFMGGRGGDWARRRAQVNRVRGNISWRYSNSVFDARPYPLNVAQSPRIPSHSQEFAVGAGGPLVIPRVYNGRDRTSFYANYQWQRNLNPFDNFATVPTPDERAGDFSQGVIPSGPHAGTVPIIYDPQSNPRGARSAFPGNQIPASRLSTAAWGLLKFIPLPNLAGRVQNFHLQEALPSASNRFMGRVGHRISAKDNLNVFYFLNSSRSNSVSSFPGLTRHSSVRSQNLNLSETHTFSPHTINTFMLNFNRQRTSILNPFAFREDISGGLGIQGISADPRDWGLPLIQFTNFTGLNDVLPSLVRNQTLRVADFLIWNSGKHNARFGAEVRRVQLNTLTDPDARGTFTFSGFISSDFTPQGFPVAGTGFDFADFLLGLPQATSVRFGTSSNYFRSWVYSAFVQDDWRVSSRVTLNLGLRYEYFQPFTEKFGHLSNLAFDQGFLAARVVTGQSPPGGYLDSLIYGDANNLAPRVGLAYRPWTQRKLVLRAGYGIFYDAGIYQRLVPHLANQPPFAQASTLLTSPSQVLTLENGFPEIAPSVLRNTYAVDSRFRSPYAQTWSFRLEQEIARNLILSVGYVGTKGSKLDLLLAPNRAAPGSPLTTQDRLALRNALQFTYETSGAASIYHALQASLRRQFRGGFSARAEYTFAKSIDNSSSVGGAGRTVAQNHLDLVAERGLSVFDLRHRLRLNYDFEFPFGERKRWFSRGGWLALLLGNWEIEGDARIQSGAPYTARVLGNVSNNSGTGASFSERAQATGLPVALPASERTPARYINPSAFTLPPAGQFGNAGRNTIPGPGMIDFDVELQRTFLLSREKGVRATFEVQAENVLNTPNFSGLSTVVNASDFGRITSVRPMRTLSFQLRVRF